MMTLTDWLFAAAFPVCQMMGMVALGLLLRVDRKPKGGGSC